MYYAFTNRFDFSYLIMSIFFFGIVLVVNVLCMLLTSVLIKFVKLILQGSKIILADEPTSGLDKNNEAIVMSLLQKLNERGVTIIMVTHNMNLCDYFSRVIDVEKYR